MPAVRGTFCAPFAAMRLPKLLPFWSILILIAAGCAKTAKPSKGGEDAGAGNSVTSTAEEVEAAIKEVWELSISEDSKFLNALFNSTKSLSASELGINKEAFSRAKIVLETVFLESLTEAELKEADEYNKPRRKPRAQRVLAQSKLELLKNGPCAAAKNHNGDASVSAFATGARICYSVQNLMRYPKSSLRLEVIALLVHELAHINGFQEDDAILAQKAIVARASMYFSPQYSAFYFERLYRSFFEAQEKFSRFLLFFEGENDASGLVLLYEHFEDVYRYTGDVRRPNLTTVIEKLVARDYLAALATLTYNDPLFEEFRTELGKLRFHIKLQALRRRTEMRKGNLNLDSVSLAKELNGYQDRVFRAEAALNRFFEAKHPDLFSAIRKERRYDRIDMEERLQADDDTAEAPTVTE